MAEWKLKSCPRCHGDIFIDSDMYGTYEHCLQCAHIIYRHEEKSLANFQEQMTEEKKKPQKQPVY